MTDRYTDLATNDDFLYRHIGPDEGEQAAMLSAIGLESLDDLIERTVPSSIRSTEPLALGEAMTEEAVITRLRRHAENNRVATSLIGMGYCGTVTPPVIQRNLLENPAWYTAYTPYQPEISQGRLEALINFQTMVSDLTGMEIANASLLDEATAAAEAMTFAKKVGKAKGSTLVVSNACHPQTLDVLATRAEPLGIRIVLADDMATAWEAEGGDAFAAIVQYPDTIGTTRDWSDFFATVHETGALAITIADILALTVLTPPGEMGADVVVGSTQRFGVPMGFGGPHAAYFATRDAYKRSLPGRLVGVSIDTHGAPAYRLALQTREQHIRRDKATSNICTAQVLLAVIAGMYAVWHGPDGLRRIARRVNRLTMILARGLIQLGYRIETTGTFDTIVVKTDDWTHSVIEMAQIEGINLRVFDDRVGITLDETSDRALVERLWSLTAFDSLEQISFDQIDAELGEALPDGLVRTSAFMTHPVFTSYRSETDMLRYLRRLADKDIALDRSMIPLGSCTMKLNATTEMLPITWPEFANIHPFAPKDQVEGYIAMIRELESWLAEITGYAAVSMQPNAGSQGEYAGLLAIRAYHRSRGEAGRDICLIPSSAHGTNPASATMAGMRVVVVKCDENGNVDVEDLKAKAAEHSDALAALMVTYPSTHGVFEEAIGEICGIVHDHGGQVYMDGANLNAMVGLCRPGRFGSDVSHLNLHKTFCIPHGGGGPGVGPIGVGAHLVPFLPGHRTVEGEEDHVGAVSAAAYGSAGILPISWAYVAMMGASGLKRATEVAILSANYLAKRLGAHYPVLYTGRDGLVAHECIIDLRPLKDACGVTVDDVAKRLMDYGFHAPTMSFPVAGTLMIEPTESESLAELDRFCEAMIAIRAEIAAVEKGEIAAEASPLRHAPHTAEDVISDGWDRAYSREVGAYPVARLRHTKMWPPVGRIDNVHGDRHVVCSCPPMESYLDAAE